MRAIAIDRSAGRRGLTLLEMLLSLALLMMMLAAIGFFVGPWLTGAGFESQASQFAAALRFARAEAALTGRTVRLEFEADATLTADRGGADEEGLAYRVRVTQELWPLAQPGVFTAVRDLPWIEELEDLDRVLVTDVRLTGPDAVALRALTEGFDDDAEMGDAAAGITFYPDGTSDSAEIVLSPTGRGDNRRAVVTLAGLTGTVRYAIVSAARLEGEGVGVGTGADEEEGDEVGSSEG